MRKFLKLSLFSFCTVLVFNNFAYATTPVENFTITYINNSGFTINYNNDWQNEASQWSSIGDFNTIGSLANGESVTFGVNQPIWDHWDGSGDQVDEIPALISPQPDTPTPYLNSNSPQIYMITVLNPQYYAPSLLLSNTCSPFGNNILGNDDNGILYNIAEWGGNTNIQEYIPNTYGPPNNNFVITFTGWVNATSGDATGNTLGVTVSVNGGPAEPKVFAFYCKYGIG